MLSKFKFEMKPEAVVCPSVAIQTTDGTVHRLHVVEEDIAEALVVLGDRAWVGPVTMRLTRPLCGSGKFAGCRTEHLLVEAEPRTVSISVILNEPTTFQFTRQEFCRHLRGIMKELNKLREGCTA